MDAVRVDVDWLRRYAGELDERTDETRAVRSVLDQRRLEPEAFGGLGRSLRTPEAYRRAADTLLAQLRQAETVIGAAARALREAADHYAGHDEDAAVTLDRRADRAADELHS